MQALQKKTGIANYDAAYSSALSTIAAFAQKKLSVDTEHAAAAFLSERSQQFNILKAQLARIDSNIAEKQEHIGKNLASTYQKYSVLRQDIQQDSERLLLDDKNLLSVEKLAVENAYYLDYIEAPVKQPTDPTEPKSLKWSGIILLGTFILYLIVK